MISSVAVLSMDGFAHCAPLKLPDKHKALEIAEAMIDETDTGCFHTGVGKKDSNFMMLCLKCQFSPHLLDLLP